MLWEGWLVLALLAAASLVSSHAIVGAFRDWSEPASWSHAISALGLGLGLFIAAGLPPVDVLNVSGASVPYAGVSAGADALANVRARADFFAAAYQASFLCAAGVLVRGDACREMPAPRRDLCAQREILSRRRPPPPSAPQFALGPFSYFWAEASMASPPPPFARAATSAAALASCFVVLAIVLATIASALQGAGVGLSPLASEAWAERLLNSSDALGPAWDLIIGAVALSGAAVLIGYTARGAARLPFALCAAGLDANAEQIAALQVTRPRCASRAVAPPPEPSISARKLSARPRRATSSARPRQAQIDATRESLRALTSSFELTGRRMGASQRTEQARA